MNALLGIFAVVALAASASTKPARSPKRTTGSCLPDTSVYVATIRSNLADFVSGTASEDSMYRARNQLPQVAASQVQTVQTDSVCQLAAAALATKWGTGSASDSTWVISVGSTRYLVFNLKQVDAGRVVGLLFDSSFNYLAAIVL
jgi:hypothetical protein